MVRRAAEVMGLLDEAANVADTTVIVMALQSRIDVDQEGYANILVIEATDTNPLRQGSLLTGRHRRVS